MYVCDLFYLYFFSLSLLQEDEVELAKKLAALKWHGKELEVSLWLEVRLEQSCYKQDKPVGGG